MKKIGILLSLAIFAILFIPFDSVPLSANAAGQDRNAPILFNMARCEEYISEEELKELVSKNKIVYRYFYSYDTRGEMIHDHIYTVNMPDFTEFGEFYSFVASVYTSDTVNELFYDFQGHGRSFFEEDGLFLVDQAVTFTATTSLYSPYDEIQILSGSEREISFIYWFAYPQSIIRDENVVFESFGVKMTILKENGEWRLSGMIRSGWESKNTVFHDLRLQPCSVFSPVIKIDLYVMNLRWELYCKLEDLPSHSESTETTAPEPSAEASSMASNDFLHEGKNRS